MDVDEDARFEVAEQPPVPPEPTWMDVDEDARFEVAEELAQLQTDQDNMTKESQTHRATIAEIDGQLSALEARERETKVSTGDLRKAIEQLQRQAKSEGYADDVPDLALVSRDRHEWLARQTKLEGLLESLPSIEGFTARLAALREAENADEAIKRLSARKSELQHQLGSLRQQIELCNRFIEVANNAGDDHAHSVFDEYGPMISGIYQRLSVHPYFGGLLPELRNREFRVRLAHPDNNEVHLSATEHLSTAQNGLVALSIFLASGFIQTWSSLKTVILDDPVQHLDDLNAHALLDLLKQGAYLGRQIIVTTADVELYRLMIARFAHLSNHGGPSFKALRFKAIDRDGPEIVDDTHLAAVSPSGTPR